MVLSPYGLGGALTGQAHKMSEPAVRKLMEEWSCFYPTVLRPAPPQGGPGEHAYDPHTHVAVEVIVGMTARTHTLAVTHTHTLCHTYTLSRSEEHTSELQSR